MGPLLSCARSRDSELGDNPPGGPTDSNESNDSSEAVSPPRTPGTVALAGYLKGALARVCGDFPQDILLPSANPPMLRKGVVNHVLVYRGSFNPPHVGHKTLLAHAFFRSSYENMVGAIIVPSSDEHLEVKMGRLTKAKHLP